MVILSQSYHTKRLVLLVEWFFHQDYKIDNHSIVKIFLSRRRRWQPTPIFLPGKSHGQRSLVGYSPWSYRGLYMTEWWSRHKIGNKQILCVQFFVTPWTVARPAPLSMGFPRQEYWSGLPSPSPIAYLTSPMWKMSPILGIPWWTGG